MIFPKELFINIYEADAHGLIGFGYESEKRAANIINGHCLGMRRFLLDEGFAGVKPIPDPDAKAFDFRPLKLRPGSDGDYPANGTGFRLSEKAFARVLKRLSIDGEAGPDAVSDWISDHIEQLLDVNGEFVRA